MGQRRTLMSHTPDPRSSPDSGPDDVERKSDSDRSPGIESPDAVGPGESDQRPQDDAEHDVEREDAVDDDGRGDAQP